MATSMMVTAKNPYFCIGSPFCDKTACHKLWSTHSHCILQQNEPCVVL